VKPRRLRDGDVVGLIAPSGVLDPAGVERRVRNLESLGFKVRLGRHLLASRGGYAGSAGQRVGDLHAMFRDPEVAGVWAARGGSGASALLPLIDYDLVRAHPKVLVGFSDITVLHLALYRHAGLVSFHGLTAGSTYAPFSVEHLRAVLMEPRAGHVLVDARENLARAGKDAQYAPKTWRGGVAEGRLVGGNLSNVAALMGTPYAPAGKGHVVFLEDVREAPYRVDRLLTQLHQAGLTAHAAGIILGVFDKCVPPDDEPSLTLAETLDDHFGNSPVPAGYGYSFGHIAPQFTIPVGIRARFDADARTITLLEPAVA
jgi:muramoyltetrapeptide carboxypeptidase